jgi:hypothetical protein
MRRRSVQALLANKRPTRPAGRVTTGSGSRNLGNPKRTTRGGPTPHPLAPGDPVAVLGTQPLVNVIKTDIDYTMGQDDLAVLAQGNVTITLNPNPLTVTPVIVIADSGTVLVTGPVQGGPFSIPQGKIGFFSYSPLSATWSVNVDNTGTIVVAPNYYIDPIHGSDDNPGTTLKRPLRTWSQLQNLFGGHWTTLVSVGGNTPATQGLVTVTILNDLPDNDPITFYNYLGDIISPSVLPIQLGLGFLVQGQTKVLFSGHLFATVDANPATNQPWTVTINRPAGFWAPFVGKVITCGGVRAYITAELAPVGGKATAQVSQWVTSTGSGLQVIITANAAPAPTAGAFQILDYTKVVLESSIYAGNDMNLLEFSPTETPGTFILVDLHAAIPAGTTNSRSALIYQSSNAGLTYAAADCIFDCQLELAGSGATDLLINCCFTDVETVDSGVTTVEFFGLHVPAVTAQGFGGIASAQGANVNLSGNVGFYQAPGAICSVVVSGVLQIESANFWNCGNRFNSFGAFGTLQPSGGIFLNQSGGGPLAESGNIPLWGTNNTPSFLWTGSNFFYLNITAGGDVLPTMTYDTSIWPGAPAGVIAIIGPDSSQNVDPSNASYCFNAHPFDPATATYGAARTLTWASLNVTTGAGGFKVVDHVPDVLDGFGTITLANASRPDCQSILTWNQLAT